MMTVTGRMLLFVAILLPGVAWGQAGGSSPAVGATAIDRSGTTTGASQVVMAANSGRVYCEIQSLTVDLWVSIAGTAATSTAGSYWLPSGSLFKCPTPTAPTGAISVIGSSGAPFTATEYTH